MDRKIVVVGDYDINLRIPFFKFLQRNNFEVFVFTTLEQTKQDLEINGIKAYKYYLPKTLNDILKLPILINGNIRLIKLLNYINPDIIQIFDTIPNIYLRPLLGLTKKNIVSTIPGLGYVYSEDSYKMVIMQLVYNFLQKYTSKFSRYIIFQNSDDMNLFIEKKLIPKEKAVIISSSGIDLEYFSKDSINKENIKRFYNSFNMKKKSIKFALISRLLKHKGILEYLEAAKYLKRKYKDKIEFFLVGKKDSSKRSFNIETLKKYENYVTYVGFIREIKEFIYLCDVIVLPSYYREGVPRVLLEAAALEKPVITTNVPGCKDAVIHKHTGILIQPKKIKELIKAMEFYINNKEEIKTLGRNGRVFVENKFDAKKIYLQYLQLYNKLL